MRFSDVIALLTVIVLQGLFTTTDVFAQDCFICDDMVILDDRAAGCFLQVYESSLGRAQSDGYAEVDLSNCMGTAGDENRGSLEKPFEDVNPGGREPVATRMRSSYVLDVASLECVRHLLDQTPRPISPARRYDLLHDCRNQ